MQREPAWPALMHELMTQRRVARVQRWRQPAMCIAAERLPLLQRSLPGRALRSRSSLCPRSTRRNGRGRKRCAKSCAADSKGSARRPPARSPTSLGVSVADIDAALLALEAEGTAMRGNFEAADSPARRPEPAVVRPPPARAHSSLHRQATARRDRAGAGARLPALPVRLAARHADNAHAGTGCRRRRARRSWKASMRPRARGKPRSCRRASPSTNPRGSTSNASPAASCGRDSRLAHGDAERGAAPVRSTPIALLARRNVTTLVVVRGAVRRRTQLTAEGTASRRISSRRTAPRSSTRSSKARDCCRTQVEEALAELVALGLVNSDSFGGLRALLVPADRRRPTARDARRKRRIAIFGMQDAGRWALVAANRTVRRGSESAPSRKHIEHVCRTLLRRWGVVFWKLLEREADWLPPWREMLMCLRRLEARGEIRGGRFVAGFSGEQFALPEAIGLLRDARRKPNDGEFVSLSAADPLNLVGIITPGAQAAFAHRQSRALSGRRADRAVRRRRSEVPGAAGTRRNSGRRATRCCAGRCRRRWRISA